MMRQIEEEKEITVIKNEDGHVIAEIVGELDVDALTRYLYGFKQKVNKNFKKSG